MNFSSRFSHGVISITLLFLFLTGCATYQGKVDQSRQYIVNGDPAKAAAQLEGLAKEEGKDQLVYLFDYGTALQMAGDYTKSNEVFEKAEKIADIQDYHSLSKIGASLLLSEEMVQYKGESYENVFINAMKAMNYLMLKNMDDAMVEVRKINQKLEKYRQDAKRDYEYNPFAVYLAGVIYEAQQAWDDAYISYEKAYSLDKRLPNIREDLVRSAFRASRPDDAQKWMKEFSIQPKPEWKNKDMGEIVVIHMQGWGPRKRPRVDAPRFPELYPVYSMTQGSVVKLNNGSEYKSSFAYSVTEVATKTMNDDFARLVASRVAGVATKAIVANQVGKKNKELGSLLYAGLNLMDRADLRQWSTLPESFRIARIPVSMGKYSVEVRGLNVTNTPNAEKMGPIDITVKPRQKTFLVWRSVL